MLNLKINKSLLPMKGFYFLWNAGTAPIVPFMSIYARQLGFSSVTVGIIYTVLPFAGMIAKPTMGGIADKYKCQKIIFLVAQLVATVAFLSMIFLPGVPTTAKILFNCGSAEVALETCTNDNCAAERLRDDVANNEVLCKLTCPLNPSQWETVCNHWKGEDYCHSQAEALSFTAHVPMNHIQQRGDCINFMVKNVTFENGKLGYPYCPDGHHILADCDVQCDSYALNDLVAQPALEEERVASQYQFWLLLTVYLVAWIGQAVTVSIADAICFQILEDKPHKYGYQRMYGALGWGILSIIAGVLVDVLSKGKTVKSYGPVFAIGVGTLLLGVVVSHQIRYKQQYMSASILKNIGRLATNIPVLVFMLWCICVGLCTALMWNFLFWHLEDLAAGHGCDMMSNIKTIEGLVMGIQCLGGELPFFFLSSWILKRVRHVYVMSFVLLVIGLRLLFYSVLTNPWWCLPIEFLNGPTFGLFYATMASYASIVAPPGTEATTQGLVGGAFEGIGVSLGSFLGGIFFQNYGGSTTFRIFGIAALVACVIHVCGQYFIQKSLRQAKE